MEYKLYHGDCLEVMKGIADNSVDLILSDLPYGVTSCEWDKPLPFSGLWMHYNRIAKPDAAIVLFSIQPFTTDLINSNRAMFRYDIVWEKTQAVGFFNAKKAPLRIHENILVFYRMQPTYNPIKWVKGVAQTGRIRRNSANKNVCGTLYGLVGHGEKAKSYEWTETGERYPTDVIKFSNWNGALFGNTDNATVHPTQKPVPLMEYLIRTYSNKGDVVLDSCMGAGTTGVACVHTGRDFVGIELDGKYFDAARERIERAKRDFESQPALFDDLEE